MVPVNPLHDIQSISRLETAISFLPCICEEHLSGFSCIYEDRCCPWIHPSNEDCVPMAKHLTVHLRVSRAVHLFQCAKSIRQRRQPSSWPQVLLSKLSHYSLKTYFLKLSFLLTFARFTDAATEGGCNFGRKQPILGSAVGTFVEQVGWRPCFSEIPQRY